MEVTFPAIVYIYAGTNGNGFPTIQRHAYITGYYKFIPQAANDVLRIAIWLRQGSTILGLTEQNLAAATNWTQFMTPINYTAQGTPDTCNLAFFLTPDGSTTGAVAQIDDLQFMGINDIKIIENVQIPNQFELKQNYPNPFNPTTNIEFSIPKSSDVKLVIYNQLGQTVATLVNEQLSAGGYSVDWIADGLPSGVYFYRISAGDFTQTQKLLLMQ